MVGMMDSRCSSAAVGRFRYSEWSASAQPNLQPCVPWPFAALLDQESRRLTQQDIPWAGQKPDTADYRVAAVPKSNR